MSLTAPFPWFGGKRRVAAEVWARFGDVDNYVEPFFGSGAVLLGRPSLRGNETINDLDGFVANFWRAVKCAPDAVAALADNPINENDLHARHRWLMAHRAELRDRLETDIEYFDARIAGYWVWGICCWIGSGWCRGTFPRQRPHLDAWGRGQGILSEKDSRQWLLDLATRLRRVRVCSGDWSRVVGKAATTRGATIAGVFLDPPYADTADRAADLYAVDCQQVAHDVREWALANGDTMRIALCGFEGEHQMPDSWSVHSWEASTGYRGEVGARERIWFSPMCLSTRQASLFRRGA